MDINAKHKTIKLLEDNRKNLIELGLSHKFLDAMSKV